VTRSDVIEPAVETAVESGPVEIRTRAEECARVLIVDDDPRNVRLLSSLLTGRGYDVLAAGSGEEAMRLLSDRRPATGEAPADILLMDTMMQGLSGFDVCRRLRSDLATRALPILMVISLNSVEDKERALEAGADDFISKPIHSVELFARVRSLLSARRLRDEAEAARRDLARADQDLSRLREDRTALTRSIIHDLRGPLTGIMGHAQLLKAKAARGAPDLDRLANSLLLASKQMQRMLADTLDVSLLEQGRFPLIFGKTDVRAAAAAVIAEYRGQAESNDLRLELAPEPSGPGRDPAVIDADAGLVHRIVGNLIANALKRTPAGGTVRVVVAAPRDGRLEVLVADSGGGIDAEERDRVFERGEPARDRESGSTVDRGLTLAFCRMAVAAHGGRIWAEPNASGGSTFGFFLPARREDP